MIKKTLFNTVIYRGTVAAIYGIVAGLILSLLIWTLLQVALMLHGAINSSAATKSLYPITHYTFPFEDLVTMSMCLGAVIGSIFGSITALKEEKKK